MKAQPKKKQPKKGPRQPLTPKQLEAVRGGNLEGWDVSGPTLPPGPWDEGGKK